MAQLPTSAENIIAKFGPTLNFAPQEGYVGRDEPDKSVKTHCCFCGMQCGIELLVKHNKVVGFEPPADLKIEYIKNGLAYKTIVFPVGGNSELADLATKQAAYLSKSLGARLVLVYVEDKVRAIQGIAPVSDQWAKLREEWLAKAHEILYVEEARLKALGVVDIEKVVLEGQITDEISKLTVERHADLLLLASAKRSPLGKLLMGPNTYDLFTKVKCPVLRIVR